MRFFLLTFLLACLWVPVSSWASKKNEMTLQNKPKIEQKNTNTEQKSSNAALLGEKNNSTKQHPQKQKKKDSERLRLFLQAKSILKTPHISDNHWVKLLKKMSNIRTEDLKKITKIGGKFVTSEMCFSDVEDVISFLWKADTKRVMHFISVRDSLLPDYKQNCTPSLLKTIESLSDKKFVFLVKNMSSFTNKDMSCDTLNKLMKALSSFPRSRIKALKNNEAYLFGEGQTYHWPDLIEYLGSLDNDMYYKVIKFIPKFATKEMSPHALIDLVHFLSENEF